MLFTIIVLAIVGVGGYLVYKFLKKNKDARTIVADGLKEEAKILGNKIVEETKEVVQEVKEKVEEAKAKSKAKKKK